jgi:MFS transporter, SP family, general alpha glucoside:H+ symporter
MTEFTTDIKPHGTALEASASRIDSTTTMTHQEAIRVEHTLTLRHAVRMYPKAIAWSIFVSLGVIMLGFDPQLMGNLYASPQFVRDFGYIDANGDVS